MLFFKVQRMAGYSTMKDELLCDVWLTISEDIVGRSIGGRGLFWQHVHDSLHAQKHIVPYDMHIIHHLNMRSLLYRW